MRLFTAIDIPPDVLENVHQLIERLKPAAHIKWSPARSMHITTKFIGEWSLARLDELVEALASIPAQGEIGVSIRQLGWFPNERSPRVFWAGIEAGPGLETLAAATEEITARLGVAKDRRPYSPHLTLARIKSPVDLGGLRRAIAGLDSVEFGSFTATSFSLYESELRPTGSVYTKRATFALQAAR